MPHRPDSVRPLTPDQVTELLGDAVARSGGAEPEVPTPVRRGPPRGADPEFEARSRRDTRLANDLFGRLREVRGIVAAAPLAPDEEVRAAEALREFERALLDLLRYHGT